MSENAFSHFWTAPSHRITHTKKKTNADHETAVSVIHVNSVSLGGSLKLKVSVNKRLATLLSLTTLPHWAGSQAPAISVPSPSPVQRPPPLVSGWAATWKFANPKGGGQQQRKQLKTTIISVKIQSRLSWEHLISLWKLKFYVNQLSARPCARSQGGCAILHSNEPPQKNSAATPSRHQNTILHKKSAAQRCII